MDPLVSVLLPVRNGARTLPRCLASLRDQTLAAHEVVAVDDGSEDESGRLLDEWAQGDPRLRVVHTPPHGLVAALTTALAHARAVLVARMDADDACAPNRLAAQHRRMQEAPHVDVLGSRVTFRGEAGEANDGMKAYVAWQNGLVSHDEIVRDLFVESPLVHPSVMMPAAVVRTLGGYRAFDGPEDYDLWLRAEAAGLRFAKHPDTLLEWWDGGGRLTRTCARYAPERFLDLKADALLVRHLPATRDAVVWGAGPIGKSWARALAHRGRRVRAFVEVDRKKIGMQIHGAPVAALDAVPSLGPALHLAAVGQPRGRDRIRRAATALGLEDGLDLIAVA